MMNNPKSKWLASSGKLKHVVRLQMNDPGGGAVGSISIRQKVEEIIV